MSAVDTAGAWRAGQGGHPSGAASALQEQGLGTQLCTCCFCDNFCCFYFALELCKRNLTNWIYVQAVSEPESKHTRSLVSYLLFGVAFCAMAAAKWGSERDRIAFRQEGIKQSRRWFSWRSDSDMVPPQAFLHISVLTLCPGRNSVCGLCRGIFSGATKCCQEEQYEHGPVHLGIRAVEICLKVDDRDPNHLEDPRI